MKEFLLKLTGPKQTLEDSRKIFSNQDLKNLIVPLFLEQLLSVLVGVADTFMVSYAGEAAVSGVSLVNMFNTVFLFLFSALAAGGAVVVSQYIGSRDRESGSVSAGQLMMISVVFSVIVMIFSLVLNRQILRLLFGEVEQEVMDACVTYLRISAYSYPAIAIYNAGAAIYRSMGKTRVTMYLSLASNGINIVGNAIGVFVLHAGVAGVAYPSLIARAFSAVVITALCFRRKNEVWLEWRNIFCWKRSMVKRILGIAVPNGIENGLFQLVKVALSSITALFGTVQIAANGVAQSFWSVAALMGTALGLAFVTVIGQCMGADDTDAAEYVRSAFQWSSRCRGCEIYHVCESFFDHRLPGSVLNPFRHMDESWRDRNRPCHGSGLGDPGCLFLGALPTRQVETVPGDRIRFSRISG